VAGKLVAVGDGRLFFGKLPRTRVMGHDVGGSIACCRWKTANRMKEK